MRAVLVFAACACGAPVPAPAPEPIVREAAAEARPGFELTIEAGARELRVVTIARVDGIDSWSAIPLFEELTAEDARGALSVRASAGEITFDRTPDPPLTLRYRIPAGERDELAFGEVTRFDGRVLLLPSADSPTEVSIAIRGAPPERVASTLGLGPTRTLVARPGDLRDVTWAIGEMERAEFEAREGRDVIARAGGGSSDVRWVGAEIALLRTRVDGWFGGIDAEPHTTLLVARAAVPGVPPVQAARSGIGLVVLLRSDAEWNAEARLHVAQVLARRWLGGVLRFSSPDGADEGWASYGLTRWIAQEILTDMGTLTVEERAADLTQLEGVIALEDTPTIPIARGALYAAALDARLRARNERLRAIVLELLARAEDVRTTLPRDAFVTAIRARLGDAEVARFEAQVLGTSAVDVPPGAFGPCLRRGRAVHRRFALGMAGHAGELEAVVLDGPAYRAGLRDGMPTRDLSYTLGQPNVRARITIVDDPARTIEWLPFDREVRGAGWERVPNVSEERCAER